ncbi:helix-turn-helix domain-containing protein [Pseudomonas vanderleydeniana]|uniref:AraC family transcriptional regulator n=1 Tax=Pseudomonas vanderleydeniana TaxID=2745495 RepID=A0A9E6PG27_9PSED|nr:AraC family transcriptional regulator [Pseudomonas vanderleydeniana]QXI26167.1 AraC family transcriptional regulator [Pseudomonas vanderleydeniana]
MNSNDCIVLATVEVDLPKRLKPWQVRTAKQLMLDHLDRGISVAEIARACALSRSHFSRMFKESTRLPPQEWLREQRLSKSKELLTRSRMLLVDIALECGFCDQAHFSRTFLKAEGMTPLSWRQQALYPNAGLRSA